MGKAVRIFYWLLLTLGEVSAQAVSAQQAVPNWLTGIIAVAVFLFLVFVGFLVNKAWCDDSSNNSLEGTVKVTTTEYSMTNGSNPNLDSVRSHECNEAYENVIIHKPEENVTVM